MKIRHFLDPETGHPHFYKHGVEEEMEEVLTNPEEDRMGRLRSDPEPGSAFVVTAYQLTGKTLAACRRRQKHRRQP